MVSSLVLLLGLACDGAGDNNTKDDPGETGDPAGDSGDDSGRDSGESHSGDDSGDDTDTDLALHRAVGLGGRHLTLLASDGAGSTGHRLDHLLGTIAALGAPALAAFESVTAFVGGTALHVVHAGHSVALRLNPGAVFSLVAAHGPCEGVTLSGARWPLDRASLPASSTRGISNEAADGTGDATVNVTVAHGIVTVVVPEVVS